MKNRIARIVIALATSSCIVSTDASGGEVVTVIKTSIVYCDGATDCPDDDECAVWWCQQIQSDDDDYGTAWGRCNIAPVVGGISCDDGAGICDNMSCRHLK